MIHKIKVIVSVGLVGCKREETLELDLDDDMPAAEIEKAKEEAATEWMWERIEFNWFDV